MDAKVPMLNPEEAEGHTALFFDATNEFLGRVPNSARVLAHSPHVAQMFVAFNATIQREGVGSVLSCKIKEIVVLKTSHVNSCNY